MNFKTSKISFCILNALLLSACAPTTYIALLNNTDGSVGAVSVQGAKGETTLSSANTGANLDGSSKQPFPVDSAQLQNDFGAALKANRNCQRVFYCILKGVART